MIDDNIREELTWYVFGGPGDRYSLQANSDKIAIAVMLLVSPQGMMIMYEPSDCLIAPLAVGDWENRLTELYGESMFNWLDKYLNEIYDALKTCMIGEVGDRIKLQKRLDEFDVNSVFEIEDEDTRNSIIEKYQDVIRASIYDLQPTINKLLKGIKSKLNDVKTK